MRFYVSGLPLAIQTFFDSCPISGLRTHASTHIESLILQFSITIFIMFSSLLPSDPYHFAIRHTDAWPIFVKRKKCIARFLRENYGRSYLYRASCQGTNTRVIPSTSTILKHDASVLYDSDGNSFAAF